jgi:hypothetical protein
MKLWTAWYIVLGLFLLLLFHLIRSRLRQLHPNLYATLGSPTFQHSNLGATYWRFQKFVWSWYKPDVDDVLLRSLCLLASLVELVVVILFFRTI